MIIRKASIADVSILPVIIRKSVFDVAEKFGFTADNCPKSPGFLYICKVKLAGTFLLWKFMLP